MTTKELQGAPEGWLESVAAMLPLPNRAAMPYTLGAAAEELRLWARTARQESWDDAKNRSSLLLDISTLKEDLGPRLTTALQSHLVTIPTGPNRDSAAKWAEAFLANWRSAECIKVAFEDLCMTAAAGAMSGSLRELSNIVASQLGVVALGPFGPLGDAATVLTASRELLELHGAIRPGDQVDDLGPLERVALAAKALVTEPAVGEIVVWLAYRRASVDLRLEVGQVTFLRADWAVPRAIEMHDEELPEYRELNALAEGARWVEEIMNSITNSSSRIVLARVALGRRGVAGAREDAEERVEALLSIAVGRGGVAWESAGPNAVMLDGAVVSGAYGRLSRQTDAPRLDEDDWYGINATSDVLHESAGRLSAVLADSPMPDYLREALRAFREAAMTDHRDVHFHGARAVTPRVAIALQDHALELVASFGSISPRNLTEAIEEREADWTFEQELLNGVMAPFDGPWVDEESDAEQQAERRRIEHVVSRFEGLTRVVSVTKAIEHADELLALRMSRLARADLTAAIKTATDASFEVALRQNHSRRVAAIRSRHRRVRNAINHGNPVTTAAIDSTRDFSDRVVRSALALALHAYASNLAMADLIATEREERREQLQLMAAGKNFVERETLSKGPGESEAPS